MNDPRRFFNKSEKADLFIFAGGKCSRCGAVLGKGWHADHKNPWSAGGPTDVANGAALCGPCNLKKGSKLILANPSDPRTRWQQTTLENYLASKKKDFLITACPGSGKTRAALTIAKRLMDDGTVQQVIVVVPMRRVQQQWNEAAAKFGLDITAMHDTSDWLSPEVQGAVFTYARLSNQAGLYRQICASKKTLVILDEVHHASVREGAAWGDALRRAFEGATRRLLLSGTPFRTDGHPIPFVQYTNDEAGRAIPDESMSYGEAVAAGICRPLRFECMDGTGEWLRGAARHAAAASTVEEENQTRLLEALYLHDGKWIRRVLEEANNELDRVRKESSDWGTVKKPAGGLVVAQDIHTARQYQKLLKSITGEQVEIVTSVQDEAATLSNNQIIDRFRDGNQKWIVAVAMIAEGVDIPRLSVLVFASRALTEMWFRQVMGRVVRMDDLAVTATCFIPAIPKLVELAEQIEAESDMGLKELEIACGPFESTKERELPVITVPISSGDAERDRVIESGDMFGGDELRHAKGLRDRVGGSARALHDADLLKLFRAAGYMDLTPQPQAADPTIQEPTASGDEIRRALRTLINGKVRKYAFVTESEYKNVFIELAVASGYGDKFQTATIQSLQRRLEVLQVWYEKAGIAW